LQQAHALDAVPPTVAGKLTVPERDFERALGRNGMLVWSLLRKYRRTDGKVRATGRGLAAAGGLDYDEFRRGLRRLRKLHLLTKRKSLRNCTVFGSFGTSPNGDDVYVVPPDAWRAIKASAGWGGKRTNAGRPAGKTCKPPHQTIKSPISAEVPEIIPEKIQVAHSEIKSPISGPAEIKSPILGDGIKSPISAEVPEIIPEKIQVAHFPPIIINRSAVCPSSFGGRTAPDAAPSPLPSSSEPPEGPAEVITPTTTSSGHAPAIAGAALAPATWMYPNVPPWPHIQPARVPAPPALREDMDPSEMVDLLAATYTSGVEHRYGRTGRGKAKQCWVFRGKRRPQPGDEAFMNLLEAAEKLREHNVPPAVWVSFSLDVWDHDQGAAGQGRRRKINWPAPGWLYAVPRIAKRQGWSRHSDAAARVSGARQIITPAVKEIVHRHARMRATLMERRPTTQEQVDAIVNLAFPDGLYDRLMVQAEQEVAELQREMRRRARKGEWLWE